MLPKPNRFTGNVVLFIYIAWAILVFGVVFAKDSLAPDNVTHMFILLYLGFSFLLFSRIKGIRERLMLSPKKTFVLFATISAVFVETFYMVSKPLDASLIITAQTSFSQAARNWLVDIVLTAPFYAILFLVIWALISKYQYKTWQYVLIFGFAQAIGDGSGFFLLNPGALLFLPYIMANYHAMNIVPFLIVKNEIKPENNSKMKFIVPLIAIFLMYIIGGLAIKTVAALFGLF